MINRSIQRARFPNKQVALDTWKRVVVKLPSDQELGFDNVYELQPASGYWFYKLIRCEKSS